ncbi:sensor histidine kinase [Mangrovibacillus sp. Mu-81]|jgi:two-component system, CitB family, sensor histidine kinase CitS|uniref:sensor histidine kinase n=1 Tax=Mangrovibacillus sp. Mu-81 TaxID=3121478 RepID=UPI002FE4C5ED
MKRLLEVPLQIKILGLVISLLLIVIGLLTWMFAYRESQEDVEQAEELAMQTAKTLSYMPVIQESFRENEPVDNLSAVTEQIRGQVEATAILIQNREGQIYSFVGQGNGSDEKNHRFRTLVYGSNDLIHTGEGENEVLKGIVPVMIHYDNYKRIEGTVAVEFSMQTIRNGIAYEIRTMLALSGGVLILGIFGSLLLARSIRKDTFGLEPYQISALFRERNAILQSVKEGIVAIDQQGTITMMNQSARELLDTQDEVEGKRVTEILESAAVADIFDSPLIVSNIELQYKEKTMIVNAQPIIENNEKVGTVCSFRDRTEIKKMVDALSEVQQYSHDLRAQTHEFKNKLYVLLGLIQLDKYEEAIHFIKQEADLQEYQSSIFFQSILDEKVQAILLGKIAKASEKKIDFQIDGESSLSPLPHYIGISPLIVILGNLIDNAFEAVIDQKVKFVSFFVTDIGEDIIFEIADSGKGISGAEEHLIFQKGISSKGTNRGYGLSNVKEELVLLGGSIEWSSYENEGTVMTVILPKDKQTKGEWV